MVCQVPVFSREVVELEVVELVELEVVGAVELEVVLE